MDREIKFRGKSLATGEWVYGYLLAYEPSNEYFIYSGYGDDVFEYEVDPATVGQFTGLRDKNGREIYEGDIIFRSFPFDEKRVIGFSKGSFEGARINRDKHSQFNDFPLYLSYDSFGRLKNWEIIGNVHDNPELLGGIA